MNFAIYLNVVFADSPRKDVVAISLSVGYVGIFFSLVLFFNICQAIKAGLFLQNDWETSTSYKSWTVYTQWTQWTMNTCSSVSLRSSLEPFLFIILVLQHLLPSPPLLNLQTPFLHSIFDFVLPHVAFFTTCRFWRTYLCLPLPVPAEHVLGTQGFDWLNGTSTEDVIINKTPTQYPLATIQ